MPLKAEEQSDDCFDPEQIHELASREQGCQKCELDLFTMTNAYDELKDQHAPATQFWQTPLFVVGGFGVGIGLGAIIVGTKCFGFCK